MSIDVQMTVTYKPRNSTRVPKFDGSEQPVSTMPCLLKHECSVIRPIFELRLSNGYPNFNSSVEWNYCYVVEFERYYYITDIVQENSLVWNFHCEVDVLATFREYILDSEGFIMFAEKAYNPLIYDSRLQVQSGRKVYKTTKLLSYPNAFYGANGVYVLSVLGKASDGTNGFASIYVMNREKMARIVDKMYTDDFIEEVIKTFADPNNALVKCLWLPIDENFISLTMPPDTLPIFLNQYYLGEDARVCQPLISSTIDIEVYIPYRYIDEDTGEVHIEEFRNYPPITEYVCTLPGVGIVSIPIETLIRDVNIMDNTIPVTIHYTISMIDGKITWKFLRTVPDNREIDAVLAVYTGYIGSEVPLAQGSADVLAFLGGWGNLILGGSMAAAGSVVGEASMTLYGASRAGGGIVNMLGAPAMHFGVYGNLGGRSDKHLISEISAMTFVSEMSEEPSKLAKTIGRPLYKVGRIGDYEGLIKVTGVYVKCWATQEEHNMIAQYVNSSTNYIFGGIIVE